MAQPKQIAAEFLEVVKGDWMSTLQFHAKVDASVTGSVSAGSVVMLNDEGHFILGVGCKFGIPLFTWNSAPEHSDSEGRDANSEWRTWRTIEPTGVITAFFSNLRTRIGFH